jgi:hypothetical protein
VLVPTGGVQERPLDLSTAPTARFAFVWGKQTGVARLAWLDARRLRVGAVHTPSLGYVGAWAFQLPQRRLVAVASYTPDGSAPDVLQFVRLSNLRIEPGIVTLNGGAGELLWARPDRLVAVTYGCCGGPGASIATIDVAQRRIAATTEIPGVTFAAARSRDTLVLLQTEPDRIAAPTLCVVSADGAIRSVRLDGVSAGRGPRSSTDPVVYVRRPALVVDRDGAHAYVVQPDGPAAEIDLRTLAVSYHDLKPPRSALARMSAWLTPAAEAKGDNGSTRTGVWLGNRFIGVTGKDSTFRTSNTELLEATTVPAGLSIVDTRDWTIRMLDPRADSVTVADKLLLATGLKEVLTYGQSSGMGLAAYRADRSVKFTLFGRAGVSVMFALAGRAYVVPWGFPDATVVDLRTGRRVGERPLPLPTPLIGDGS